MISFVCYSILIIFAVMIMPQEISVIAKRKKIKVHLCLFFSVAFMAVMAGFRRYDIGNDTDSYLRFFTHMLDQDYEYDARVELLFRYLTIFITKLSSNYTVFLCITSILIFSALAHFVKNNCDDHRLFVAVFWFFSFVAYVSPLRQSLALAVVLWSLKFAKEKRFIVFGALVVIASLFHGSAIVCIVFPFLYHFKPHSWRIFLSLIVIVILITTNAISLFSSYLLGDYYSRYLDVESGVLAAAFNALFGIIPIIIDSFSKHKNNMNSKNDDGSNMLRWSSALYSGFYVVSLYTSGAGRVAYYFLPMTIVYWCRSLDIKRIGKKNRIIFLLVLFTVLIVYRVLVIIYRPLWNSFFPYYFIWQ